mmetsp:Transcript_4692/g.7445  ORF Transcript_4692/g.7445 Transcript_4692/m.7445 type:complete len:247 (+) Transcript_4692:1370-2110(+)
MLCPEFLSGARDHLAEAFERAGLLVFQVVRIDRKAQHTSVFSDRADDIILLVSQSRSPGMGIGMGDCDRALRQVRRLNGGTVAGMAHIDHKTHAVHLFDDLFAHAGDAHVLIFITAGRKQGLVIIGQLHETSAKRVDDLHKSDVVFNRAWVLEAKEHSGTPGFTSHINVRRPLTFHDQFRVLFKPAVPFFKVQNRFTEVFVIGDGNVNRIHAPFAQLAENLFRPVGILQVINQHHATHQNGEPLEI